MTTKTAVLIFVLLVPCAGWSADKAQMLDVKLGLWEVTTTHQMTGMPPMPPEAMARLTPEQRAKIEAAMKGQGSPKSETRKHCLTKEELEKDLAFNDHDNSCTKDVVNSTSTRLQVRLRCESEGVKMNGEFNLNALNSETVKGDMHMTSAGGGNSMNMNSTFNAKWLSASCGNVKE